MTVSLKKMTAEQEVKARLLIMKEIVRRMISKESINFVSV